MFLTTVYWSRFKFIGLQPSRFFLYAKAEFQELDVLDMGKVSSGIWNAVILAVSEDEGEVQQIESEGSDSLRREQLLRKPMYNFRTEV
jgi:hypothetical protein